MSATVGLEKLLEPLSLCLDAESARRLLNLRVDPEVEARVEFLAQGANEGTLTASELAEYDALISVTDIISILKLQVRRHLDQRPQ